MLICHARSTKAVGQPTMLRSSNSFTFTVPNLLQNTAGKCRVCCLPRHDILLTGTYHVAILDLSSSVRHAHECEANGDAITSLHKSSLEHGPFVADYMIPQSTLWIQGKYCNQRYMRSDMNSLSVICTTTAYEAIRKPEKTLLSRDEPYFFAQAPHTLPVRMKRMAEM